MTAASAYYVVRDEVTVEFGMAESAGSRVDPTRLGITVAAPPGMFGVPPWTGVGLRVRGQNRAAGTLPRTTPMETTAKAVREGFGEAAAVAVLCAGGPADLVLLHHAVAGCAAEGRDLLVLVPDRVDASGSSAAILLTPTLAGFASGVDMAILETDVLRRGHRSAWRPSGPAASPGELALPAALLAARDWGADLLLTAAGCDDLLRWPPSLPSSGTSWVSRARALMSRRPADVAVHTRHERLSAAWAEFIRQSVTASAYPVRAAVPLAMAPVMRLATEQPWFDKSGQRLPAVAAPLYTSEVVLTACLSADAGLPKGGSRTTYQRRHTALAKLVPEAMRAEFPAQEPTPVRIADHRPVHTAELTASRAIGLLDSPDLVIEARSPMADRLLAVEAWLTAATESAHVTAS